MNILNSLNSIDKNFFKSHENYVLVQRDGKIFAEERGIITWIRANILSRFISDVGDYRLSAIVNFIKKISTLTQNQIRAFNKTIKKRNEVNNKKWMKINNSQLDFLLIRKKRHQTRRKQVIQQKISLDDLFFSESGSKVPVTDMDFANLHGDAFLKGTGLEGADPKSMCNLALSLIKEITDAEGAVTEENQSPERRALDQLTSQLKKAIELWESLDTGIKERRQR